MENHDNESRDPTILTDSDLEQVHGGSVISTVSNAGVAAANAIADTVRTGMWAVILEHGHR